MKIVAAWLVVVGSTVAQQPMSQVRDMGHPVSSRAKRPMTFQDLMAMKRVSDPQVSPGGKWVMFSVTEVSLEKNTKVTNLWVVPLGEEREAGSSASPRNDKQKSKYGDSGASLQNDGSGGMGGRGGAGGGQERQITFGVVDQTGGRFSPDGKWILLLSNGGGAETQIWTAKWDEATGTIQKPYPLTNLATGADGAIWSPDSKRILFASGVYPECSVGGGKDKGKYGDSGAALQNDDRGGVVGSAEPTHRDEAVMNGARSGGGQKREAGSSAAPRNDKEDATWAEEEACDKAKMEAEAKSLVKGQLWTGLFYRHWNAYTGKRRSHVLVVSAANGEEIRDLTPSSVVGDAEVPTFSLGGPLGYAWAPDSREIAYVANLDAVPAASTNNDVFTLRLDEAGARAVKVSTSLGSDDGPQYSPDGKWLAFRSQARAGYESDRFRLMLFDRSKAKSLELIPKFRKPSGAPYDGWIDEFVWSGDSAAIIFTSGLRGQEAIFNCVATVSEKDINPVFVRMTDDGEYGDLRAVTSKSGEETTIFATKMKVNQPSEIVSLKAHMVGHTFTEGMLYSPEFEPDIDSLLATETVLTHLNTSILSGMQLQALDSFWFAGAEKAKVQGFIVKPPNFDASTKYPVKFLIHGGPQGAWGDAWSYRWNPELMAASGYVVVMVNPRGSTGYGQSFIDGVNGDWGGKAYEDLMRGLDAAEKQFPFIDKNRECALGASYGGFMANWLLTHTNRFKCIVTHDGMYNPAAAYGDTEEMWFNEWEFRRRMPDGTLDKEPASPWRYASLPASEDPFRKWSPMLHIQDAKTPTLVIHGQRDYRLDVSEGLQLFTALQRLGVPSEMLYFPDEGHWVLKPKNSELWNKTVSDWCDRWTKSGAYAAR